MALAFIPVIVNEGGKITNRQKESHRVFFIFITLTVFLLPCSSFVGLVFFEGGGKRLEASNLYQKFAWDALNSLFLPSSSC